MNASPISTNALPLSIVGLAVLFAAVVTFLSARRTQNTFITLTFETVTLCIGIVVVVSLFYKPLFDWVADHSVFIAVLALSSILNALKDIVAIVDRTRSTPASKQQESR